MRIAVLLLRDLGAELFIRSNIFATLVTQSVVSDPKSEFKYPDNHKILRYS
jgi:hypothetical protein